MSKSFLFFFVSFSLLNFSSSFAEKSLCWKHAPEIRNIRSQSISSVLEADREGGRLYRSSIVYPPRTFAWEDFRYKDSYSEFAATFAKLMRRTKPPGMPYLAQGLAEAREWFLEVYANCIQLHGHPSAYFERGRIYYDKGEFAACAQDLSRYLEETTNEKIEIDSLVLQGAIHNEMGEYEQAIQKLSEIIEETGGTSEAYFERAVAYFETGQLDKVKDDFEKSGMLDWTKKQNCAYPQNTLQVLCPG